MMLERFYGNAAVRTTFDSMLERNRIPQTILLAGPQGIGKATLARRFASALLHDKGLIERDDLSLSANAEIIAEREKWPAEKRGEDPLLFSSHPDFVTFAPDGPLRQIGIQQMRTLKERAQYKPLKGSYRVFLIDQLERANEQAANSLLKTLEEPPEHLILFITSQNPFELLPTIRSRSVLLHLAPLTNEEMAAFARERGMPSSDRRLPLAAGSPGRAISIDLEIYDKRRASMLKLIEIASGIVPFSDWSRVAEAIGSSRSEKLDGYLEVLSILIEDLVALRYERESIRNPDLCNELTAVAQRIDFEWLRRAVARIDELLEFVKRNIQKSPALDALVMDLRIT